MSGATKLGRRALAAAFFLPSACLGQPLDPWDKDSEPVLTIPFKLNRGNSVPMVEARFNQGDVVWLGVDTGSTPPITLERTLARKAGMLNAAEGEQGRETSSSTSGMVALSDMTLGRYPFDAQEAVVRDLPLLRKQGGMVGLIGIPFLNQFARVTFDYPSRTLRLGGPTMPLPGTRTPLLAPRFFRDAQPFVQGVIDDRVPVDLLIDTGGGGLYLPASVLQQVGVFRRVRPWRIGFVDRPPPLAPCLTRVPSLRIGSEVIPSPLVLSASAHSRLQSPYSKNRWRTAVVGSRILRHFVVSLDLRELDLWLRLSEPWKPGDSFSCRRPAFDWKQEDDHLAVTWVAEPSEALRRGIQSGDRILKVAGKPVEKMTPRDLAGYWRSLSGDEFEVVVRRGQETLRLQIPLEVPLPIAKSYGRPDTGGTQ